MQMKAFHLISVESCLSVTVLFITVTKKPVQCYLENSCHTSTHIHTICPFTSFCTHTLYPGNITSSCLPHWLYPNYFNISIPPDISRLWLKHWKHLLQDQLYPFPGHVLIVVVYLLCQEAAPNKEKFCHCLSVLPSSCYDLYVVQDEVIQSLG